MFYRRHHRLILSALVLVIIASVVVGFEMAQSLMPAHASPALVGPTATTWYFAEGRIGSGFREYFTIDNPNASPCLVTLKYLYSPESNPNANYSKTVNIPVAAQRRATVSVNADLSVTDSNPHATTVSAIASVATGATPNCGGVVAERPMYFTSYHGTSGGTDVIGATQLNTNFEFADISTGNAGTTFLSILNPQNVTANVTVTYYANGTIVNQESLSVAPMSRGTFHPNNLNMPLAHVAAIVTSDQAILVEKPAYFTAANGYGVSGASDVVGVSASANTWYFAEGMTTPNAQTNLLLANLDPANTADVTITLKSSSGHVSPNTSAYHLTISPNSQTIWNANANNTFTGATSDVSAEVASSGAQIVAQRQMFTTYQGLNTSISGGQTGWQAQGMTEAFGATQPKSVYNFAEGYSAQFYNEWLQIDTLTPALTDTPIVTPTATPTPTPTPVEHIDVTLTNTLGNSYTQHLTIPANSRYSLNITKLVEQNLIQVGSDNTAYAAAMTVSSSDGPFIAERTMYYHPVTYPVQGGNSVVGYTG